MRSDRDTAALWLHLWLHGDGCGSNDTGVIQRFRRSEGVETRGLEPLTPALQRQCSAS
jgi:hypothetical protein